MTRRLLHSLVLAIAAVSYCAAQNPFGRIRGRVTDRAGAPVPGAKVTVVHVETNLALEDTTNADG